MEENERISSEEISMRRQRRRQKKKRNKRICVLIIAAAVLIAGGNILFGADRTDSDKIVTIADGSSTFEIADILKEEGVISKKLKFIATVITSGNYGKLKFGTFEFKEGMSHGEIVGAIVNGGAKKETITLTIPEGYSVENIINRMTELGIADEASVKAALEKDYDYGFISEIPRKDGQKYRLQGFLFPSTYEFYKDVTPETVIDTLLGEFDKQYKSVAGSYENVYDVITKASMVEREARIDSERSTIAGVFENRLKSGMKLQIDATVAYIVSDGDYDVERILYKDLETDSLYNTYLYEGLPVGPIANPGIESIKAALNPEKHDYLFYHTDENKKDGSHIFTKNFEEHKETMN